MFKKVTSLVSEDHIPNFLRMTVLRDDALLTNKNCKVMYHKIWITKA